MPPHGFRGIVGSFPNPVVLKPSIDMIRFLMVHIDGIELSNRRAVVLNPLRPEIIGDVQASVITVDKVSLNGRVYP
jgi:hypothetical protein